MTADRPLLNIQSIIEIDDVMGEIHGLLARELIAGEASPAVIQAEQKLHDLRNRFAALTGLGFKFAVCDGELV